MRNVIIAGTVAALIALPASSLAQDRGAAARIDGDTVAAEEGDLVIRPVSHASFVMAHGDTVVYADPVGGGDAYSEFPEPDIILVTHGHGDHFDAETLAAILGENTMIIAPPSVYVELEGVLQEHAVNLANGDSTNYESAAVEAVPAYNLTEDRLQYHPQGEGNGYVVTLGGLRVYIAGDTEDVPEMRSLEDIDVAFVPMNLPYTMDVEAAADAVAEMQPGIVYPYHYQGSDVEAFAELVRANSDTEVRIGAWYEDAEAE